MQPVNPMFRVMTQIYSLCHTLSKQDQDSYTVWLLPTVCTNYYHWQRDSCWIRSLLFSKYGELWILQLINSISIGDFTMWENTTKNVVSECTDKCTLFTREQVSSNLRTKASFLLSLFSSMYRSPVNNWQYIKWKDLGHFL